MFSLKMAKLEFPRYSDNDPTKWFNRVEQFFEFQCTTEVQKVPLASLHNKGEANQWWQWLHRAYKEKEFEKLGNRIQCWMQKALVWTFMGGLRPDIAEGIRMFKSTSLKEAFSLPRMRDDQLLRQRKFTRTPPTNRPPLNLPSTMKHTTVPIKRLTWEEMQRRRAQGLCFNCDDKFSVGYNCRGPQLLLLEGNINEDSEGDINKDTEVSIDLSFDPGISLHALTGWSDAKTMRAMAKIERYKVAQIWDEIKKAAIGHAYMERIGKLAFAKPGLPYT
ncbi:hypothetical protein JRO89_XS04G0135500 [Xanthoceras sorbifolium]|uniref:Retrotransposon gag domain-containing protein n=1 Tax=Xanthoceras sorbifolium TaxID=99658 RepID=A0ABQ8I5M6_9ROSI|nr:hypothetical protein JRO89_XS04G0135500 [Xanthoceras sorbifolium]